MGGGRLKAAEAATARLYGEMVAAQLAGPAGRALLAALGDPVTAPDARAVVNRVVGIAVDGAERAAGGPAGAGERLRARSMARAAEVPAWAVLVACYRRAPLATAAAMRDTRDGGVPAE
ncbi:hypothetical protein [Streptomyces sp. C10-9-1]|uniref:hypothetical protein n=1 Tax=Streptomyces sp. C10-9-1 TaxID=1859285 RepID=UPI003F49BDAC